MFKILALDPGDRYIGTAISDELGITATPYKTIAPDELIEFLSQIILAEHIKTVVIGLPKTLRGTNSAQTQKSITLKIELSTYFPNLTFVLWDERLSSQGASKIRKTTDKAAKLHLHSIAAAIILQTYLDGLALQQNPV